MVGGVNAFNRAPVCCADPRRGTERLRRALRLVAGSVSPWLRRALPSGGRGVVVSWVFSSWFCAMATAASEALVASPWSPRLAASLRWPAPAAVHAIFTALSVAAFCSWQAADTRQRGYFPRPWRTGPEGSRMAV